MKKYNIDFDSILSKGHIVKEIKDDTLHLTTTERLATNFRTDNLDVKSYLYLSNTYKLPLRIDLRLKIDSPGFYLFFGKGHLNFGTPWSDNRRIDDIVQPNYKPRFFHNQIPINEFVNISVIYDLKAMQILINGEERFYSEKEKYMKSKLLKEENEKGFSLKLACDKRSNLVLKSLSITEYDKTAGIIHTNDNLPLPLTRNEAVELGEKPKFESCISLLPRELGNEIVKTDAFLRSLKPLKFKRQIAKHGNKITYLASDYGFSYALYPSNDIMYHSLSWYIITNSKPELWHRKKDMMEATLNKLDKTSPEFAERMFQNLRDCIACCKCIVKTPYEYKGKKKLSCHGIMDFKMCISDFEDVRTFINTVNELLIEEQN
ncbi:hypothetical protein [Vallitalea okinawensis]|uniref:hypothetical protein n=1 Tax=Vallitalea okinawensis TaxID=2078660 RepID=UPI000CFDB887|nr:hypothetical protein [Vallitalea okinawensis]